MATEMAETRVHTIKKLSGDNYSSWSYQVMLILMESDLWTTIEPGETKPEETEENAADIRKYAARQGKALAKICLSISEEQQQHVRHLQSPKEVWEELERLYAPRDSKLRVVQLRRKLYSVKFSRHSTINSYLADINNTVTELTNVGDKVEDGDLAMVILCGLSEEWDNVVSTICNLPAEEFTSANVRRRLLAEWERKRDTTSQNTKRVDAMITKAGRQSAEQQQSKPTGKSDLHCHFCGRRGHLVRECRAKQKKYKNFKKTTSDKPRSDALAVCGTTLNAQNEDLWIVDSGATHHITPSTKYLPQISEATVHQVTVANGATSQVIGQGTAHVQLNEPRGKLDSFRAIDALYVPDLTHSVLSVPQMVENGRKVIFDASGCSILSADGDLLLKTPRRNGLFAVETTPSKPTSYVGATASDSASHRKSLDLWHQRLMHVNKDTILKMSKSDAVSGLDCSDTTSEQCEGCLLGKSRRQPFPKHDATTPKYISTVPLELVHTDLMGPFDTASWGGAKYALTFIDDATRFTSIRFLRKKSETLEQFKKWVLEAENQTGFKLKRIRSDNGGEYCSSDFEEFCESRGIVHEKTMPYTPQQNAVAERYNLSLLNLVRSTTCTRGLPKASWAELMNTAVYVKNRVTNKHCTKKTPHELWFKRKPSVRHLRVIGCRAFVHQQKPTRKSKLDPRAQEGILVGYPKYGKGWRIWLPSENKICESRDCTFIEDQMPRTNETIELPFIQYEVQDDGDADQQVEPTETRNSKGRYEQDAQMQQSENDVNQPSRSEQRETHPMKLRDLPSRMARVAENRNQSNQTESFASAINSISVELDVPTTYEEAISGPEAAEWIEAMHREMDNLEKYKVWQLDKLPQRTKPIQCKWVFAKKTDSEGNVVRYKARLVAKGFEQKKGIDFDESYAPVPSFDMIRILLALATENKWSVDQLDVECAYLHSQLDHVLYMEQPQGFVQHGKEHLHCKLEKSLYGLRQSGRCWNQRFDTTLRQVGFKSDPSEPCVYQRETAAGTIIIVVYVDDILLFSTTEEARRETKDFLINEFNCRDLGTAKQFLGIKLTFGDDHMKISQESYITHLLERFGLTEARTAKTPMELRPDFSSNSSEEGATGPGNEKYLELIGSLLYLSQRTRPDIAFSVAKLAQFSSCHREEHWKAAKRILRYLKKTLHVGITYRRTGNPLLAYVDADWATCETTRRSTTGYVIFLAGGPVAWKSVKQSLTTLSSMEAEYVAMSAGVREITWIKNTLTNLKQERFVEQPVEVRSDSQAAIAHATKGITNSRTKHIDIRFHHVKERIQDRTISLCFVTSENNVADIFTKPLTQDGHYRHLGTLCGENCF